MGMITTCCGPDDREELDRPPETKKSKTESPPRSQGNLSMPSFKKSALPKCCVQPISATAKLLPS